MSPRRVRPARVRVGAAVVLLAVLIAGAAIWWATPRVVTGATGQRLGRLPAGVAPADLNLLLVTLDTTRADRLGAYGFDRVETPHLDRIAAEGVLFEQAIASAPLTLPSHSTMFTGKSPPGHGVRDNGGFFLDDRESTLAEQLRAGGFATGGFVGAYVLDAKWGIAQGFDTYVDDFDLTREESLSLATIDRRATEVTDRALAWLDTVAPSRFFGWVHYYDAHSPYDPPEPFKSRYAGRPYVGEIAFVDSEVGRLIAWLDARGLSDRTVVVVMGDHGESLGEHGEGTHGFFVYESVLRVPFLVRAPFDAMRGRRIRDVVRAVDLMPTVLDLLGLQPAPGVEGESLTPLLAGEARELALEAYSEAIYPRFHFGWSDLRAVRAGRYKFIAAPRPELYDLDADPHETRNLYAERRTLGERMAVRLDAIERRLARADAPVEPLVEIDPETRDRLAALGYVGTFAAPAREGDRSRLADPKDKIGLFNLMNAAREESRRTRGSARSVGLLEQVLEQDPAVIDAWFMLGNEHFRRQEFERAIPAYRRALELKPDYDLAIINLANSYRALGRDEDALAGYRRFMDLDPRNPQIRYQTAQILIDAGRLDEAADRLAEALALEPALAAARNALGVVRFRRGDLPGAEREIRAAIAARADVRLAHFNLALLAEERGDLRTAIQEYRREIELYPASYRALFNLGKVYERVGDRAEQIAMLRQSIERNPEFAEGHLFLAKAYLDHGRQLDEALALAARGIELGPRPPFAALGHYILADLYERLGRPADAARAAARARRIESRGTTPAPVDES